VRRAKIIRWSMKVGSRTVVHRDVPAQFQRLAKKTPITAAAAPIASRPAMIAPQCSCGHASALDMTPSTTPKRKPQRAQRSNRAGLT
jgi:hypothetical protein